MTGQSLGVVFRSSVPASPEAFLGKRLEVGFVALGRSMVVGKVDGGWEGRWWLWQFIIYTWNPNGAPCFCWKLGFVLRGLTFKNRGHWGSRSF